MGIDLGYIATVIVVVLLSMTLHEAMHAFASYWLGDNTAKNEGRLTLNPIKHIDPVLTIGLPVFLAIVGGPIFGGAKPVPFNPQNVRWGEYGAALVGLAGPFTNLVLSFIFFGLLVISGGGDGLLTTFLQLSVVVNLGFFIFNMIPIPPLDGSRALYAIAPDPVRRFMEMMEQYGIIVVFAVVLLAGQYIGQFIGTIQREIIQVYAAIFGVPML
ncbi:MAG: site-2 protease family protein [Candidatus Saccharimonadales bacterium]